MFIAIPFMRGSGDGSTLVYLSIGTIFSPRVIVISPLRSINFSFRLLWTSINIENSCGKF